MHLDCKSAGSPNLQACGLLGAGRSVVAPADVVTANVKKADVLASPLLSGLLHYLGENPRIRKELILQEW